MDRKAKNSEKKSIIILFYIVRTPDDISYSDLHTRFVWDLVCKKTERARGVGWGAQCHQSPSPLNAVQKYLIICLDKALSLIQKQYCIIPTPPAHSTWYYVRKGKKRTTLCLRHRKASSTTLHNIQRDRFSLLQFTDVKKSFILKRKQTTLAPPPPDDQNRAIEAASTSSNNSASLRRLKQWPHRWALSFSPSPALAPLSFSFLFLSLQHSSRQCPPVLVALHCPMHTTQLSFVSYSIVYTRISTLFVDTVAMVERP